MRRAGISLCCWCMWCGQGDATAAVIADGPDRGTALSRNLHAHSALRGSSDPSQTPAHRGLPCESRAWDLPWEGTLSSADPTVLTKQPATGEPLGERTELWRPGLTMKLAPRVALLLRRSGQGHGCLWIARRVGPAGRWCDGTAERPEGDPGDPGLGCLWTFFGRPGIAQQAGQGLGTAGDLDCPHCPNHLLSIKDAGCSPQRKC